MKTMTLKLRQPYTDMFRTEPPRKTYKPYFHHPHRDVFYGMKTISFGHMLPTQTDGRLDYFA